MTDFDDRAEILPRPSSPSPAARSAAGLVVQVTARAPGAVVLLDDPAAAACEALLRREGFEPYRMDDPLTQTRMPGPASVGMVLASAVVVSDDNRRDLLELMFGVNPIARRILVAPTAELNPEVLRHALRLGFHDVVDPQDASALDASVRASAAEMRARQERVLAIGAHPDDVEIGAAGALLEHRSHGDAITVLTMTQGATGGDPRARVDEARAAADLMGARLLMADLEDTRVDGGIDTIQLIEAVVRDVQPTVVYVHSKHDNHQDHRAVNLATMSATRRVPRVLAYQSPSATDEFRPTTFVPIDRVLDHKLAALQLFSSQSRRSYLDPETVLAGARYWARQFGSKVRFAEPFEVIRNITWRGPVPLEDVRPPASGPASGPAASGPAELGS